MSRKEKEKFHYIYKTTNIKNSKFYIGMHTTSNLEDGYLGSGDLIRSSIRHHGKENHIKEILEFLPNRNELRRREKEIVNEEILKNPLCMNLMIGGEGGWTLEQQKKGGTNSSPIRWNNPDYVNKIKESSSKVFSDLWKDEERSKLMLENAKKAFSNKTHKKETRDQIGAKNSIAQKGNKNSQFGTKWINLEGINKKVKSDDLSLYLLHGWKIGRIK